MNSDTITIFRSRGRRLAKLVKADGAIVGYDEAKTFTATEHDVESLDDLHRALVWLSTRPDRCVVRAALTNADRTDAIRRLIHPDPKTGDRATLYEVPRFWVATDWDALDRPDHVDVTDLHACGMAALGRLPVAFHNAATIVCATGSHGVKAGIRVRLWHWLDRAITGKEIERWLAGIAGLDISVFRAAQVIYTAAPVFESGTDPLPDRVALIPGDDRVAVPAPSELSPPAPRPAAPMPKPNDAKAQTYAWAALRNAATRIAMAPVSARHATILSEGGRLARLVHQGLLAASTVESVMEDAAMQAGKPQGEAKAAFNFALRQPFTESRVA